MNAANAVRLLQHAIEALDAVENRQEYPGIDHARAVLVSMRAALESRGTPDPRRLHGGLARQVIDAWPLRAEASIAVIEAEEAYEQLGTGRR